MNIYNRILFTSTLMMGITLHANPVDTSNTLATMKSDKQVVCVGVKRIMPTNANKSRPFSPNSVEISFNKTAEYFEALEQDNSDLGGYSPIPYPCTYAERFTSETLNTKQEKALLCTDESYDITEEVYLLKDCTIHE